MSQICIQVLDKRSANATSAVGEWGLNLMNDYPVNLSLDVVSSPTLLCERHKRELAALWRFSNGFGGKKEPIVL